MERANEAALILSGLALGGLHGSLRKGYRRVRDPTALSPAHHAVLTAALQQELVCCVCNSTRLHKRQMLPGSLRDSSRLNAVRSVVPRAVGPLQAGALLRQPAWRCRSGRSLHLTVSSFWTPGFRPLTHMDTGRGMVDGAYRHRAWKQELRNCGDSGFIFGGLDCESRL